MFFKEVEKIHYQLSVPTAMLMAIAIRLYRKYKTFDIREIKNLRGQKMDALIPLFVAIHNVRFVDSDKNLQWMLVFFGIWNKYEPRCQGERLGD